MPDQPPKVGARILARWPEFPPLRKVITNGEHPPAANDNEPIHKDTPNVKE